MVHQRILSMVLQYIFVVDFAGFAVHFRRWFCAAILSMAYQRIFSMVLHRIFFDGFAVNVCRWFCGVFSLMVYQRILSLVLQGIFIDGFAHSCRWFSAHFVDGFVFTFEIFQYNVSFKLPIHVRPTQAC